MERRFLSTATGSVAVEQRAEGQPAVITGYAAVFYREGDPGTEFHFNGLWDDFTERILPGAFDVAVREDDVRGLFNHNPSLVLGRTRSRTLRLSIDAVGLRYEIDPPATQVGRDLVESIRRGDVTGSSFSFDVEDQTWRQVKDADGKLQLIRELRRLRIEDVGPVTFPAYQASTAGVRSAGDVEEARRAFEAWRKEQTEVEARLAGYMARARVVEIDT